MISMSSSNAKTANKSVAMRRCTSCPTITRISWRHVREWTIHQNLITNTQRKWLNFLFLKFVQSIPNNEFWLQNSNMNSKSSSIFLTLCTLQMSVLTFPNWCYWLSFCVLKPNQVFIKCLLPIRKHSYRWIWLRKNFVGFADRWAEESGTWFINQTACLLHVQLVWQLYWTFWKGKQKFELKQ